MTVAASIKSPSRKNQAKNQFVITFDAALVVKESRKLKDGSRECIRTQQRAGLDGKLIGTFSS